MTGSQVIQVNDKMEYYLKNKDKLIEYRGKKYNERVYPNVEIEIKGGNFNILCWPISTSWISLKLEERPRSRFVDELRISCRRILCILKYFECGLP